MNEVLNRSVKYGMHEMMLSLCVNNVVLTKPYHNIVTLQIYGLYSIHWNCYLPNFTTQNTAVHTEL